MNAHIYRFAAPYIWVIGVVVKGVVGMVVKRVVGMVVIWVIGVVSS